MYNNNEIVLRHTFTPDLNCRENCRRIITNKIVRHRCKLPFGCTRRYFPYLTILLCDSRLSSVYLRLFEGKMGVQDSGRRQAQHSPEHFRWHR